MPPSAVDGIGRLCSGHAVQVVVELLVDAALHRDESEVGAAVGR